MDDDAAAEPSPSRSPSSSGASPSPGTKRSRTERYALGFEFAPRVAPPPPVAALLPRGSHEWTQESTFALLDAWGERYVRAGRRSLSAEEWLEVSRLAAAAASRPAGYYSEVQCRNRIDTLRKTFRREKERHRLAALRSCARPKWVYYDKILSLMSPTPPPPPPPPQLGSLLSPVVTRPRDRHPVPRLTWGVDAGEYVLAGCADATPVDSGSDAQLGKKPIDGAGSVKGKEFDGADTVKGKEIDGAGTVKGKEADGAGAMKGKEFDGAGTMEGKEFTVLTESIRKLGEVYKRIESSKRQHMAELKRMRRDFQRDLDARWKEILEKAEAEIASLEEEDEEEGDKEEGDDNRRLGDGDGSKEHNNGTVDASP